MPCCWKHKWTFVTWCVQERALRANGSPLKWCRQATFMNLRACHLICVAMDWSTRANTLPWIHTRFNLPPFATHPSISKPPCEQLKLDEASVSFSRLWTGNIRILQSQLRPVFPSNKDKAQNAYITAALVPIFCCRENLRLGIQKDWMSCQVRLGVLSRSCAQLFPHPLAPLQVEMGRNT
jgi:hypothetical protein